MTAASRVEAALISHEQALERLAPIRGGDQFIEASGVDLDDEVLLRAGRRELGAEWTGEARGRDEEGELATAAIAAHLAREFERFLGCHWIALVLAFDEDDRTLAAPHRISLAASAVLAVSTT